MKSSKQHLGCQKYLNINIDDIKRIHETDKYDLLIIFTDGSMLPVKGVSDYSYSHNIKMFSFNKNGINSFIPRKKVKYFGPEVF